MEEIRDLVLIGLEAQFPFLICAAKNGKEALDLWESNGPFDLVISDYDMPEVNGAQLYHHIHQLCPDCPFILLSSHQSNDTLDLKDFLSPDNKNRSLSKLEQMSKLPQVVREILEEVPVPQIDGHVRVSLKSLIHLNQIPVDLYIKLSANKLVKVISANELYCQELIEHYREKVDYLYCQSESFQKLTDSVFTQIKSLLATKNLDDNSSLQIQVNATALAHQLLIEQGISPQIIHLADNTLAHVYSKAVSNGQVYSVLRKVLDQEDSYLYVHSLSIPYVAFAICSQMGWTGQGTLETIAIAALLHDSTLDAKIVDESFGLEFDDRLRKEMKSKSEIKRVYDHPFLSSALITDDLFLPPMVKEIIEQHHEKPDGTGYPRGLFGTEINPLAAVFIVSEELIHMIHRRGMEKSTITQCLNEIYDKYYRGNFKIPVEAMIGVFKREIPI